MNCVDVPSQNGACNLQFGRFQIDVSVAAKNLVSGPTAPRVASRGETDACGVRHGLYTSRVSLKSPESAEDAIRKSI